MLSCCRGPHIEAKGCFHINQVRAEFDDQPITIVDLSFNDIQVSLFLPGVQHHRHQDPGIDYILETTQYSGGVPSAASSPIWRERGKLHSTLIPCTAIYSAVVSC